MIIKEKEKQALRCIHQLMIEGRMLSAKANDPKELFDFFDGLEYLQALIIEERESTEMFELYLKEFCEQYNISYILGWYFENKP